MSTQRQRQRRTLGNGPPPDLLFGELAYSDGDGLIHVGRADGTARSFAPSETGPHTHDYAALIHGHPWSQITNTPATYPPSSHTHDYAALIHGHPWSQITNTPATYPPSSHTHDYAPLPTVGDWVPAYQLSGSGSVTMAAFSAGRWRKTGNWVEFQLRAATTATAAPAGDIWITLPPFPADLSPATWGWPCAIGPCALWASDIPRLSAIVNLQSHIRLYSNATTANYALLQANALSTAANGNQIFMAGAYRSTI